jgi:hypothetical protein
MLAEKKYWILDGRQYIMTLAVYLDFASVLVANCYINNRKVIATRTKLWLWGVCRKSPKSSPC